MVTTSEKNADILILVSSQMEQDDETSLMDLKIIVDGRSQHEFVFQVARTYVLIRSSLAPYSGDWSTARQGLV